MSTAAWLSPFGSASSCESSSAPLSRRTRIAPIKASSTSASPATRSAHRATRGDVRDSLGSGGGH
eukprot:1967566-Pleurochrysis_carterae.AAC.1